MKATNQNSKKQDSLLVRDWLKRDLGLPWSWLDKIQSPPRPGQSLLDQRIQVPVETRGIPTIGHRSTRKGNLSIPPARDRHKIDKQPRGRFSAFRRIRRACPGQLPLAPPEEQDTAEALRRIILNIRQTSEACEVKYWKTICLCGTRVVRSGCGKRDCPECSHEAGRRRASRVFKRFQASRRGQPLVYTTFTLPPEIRVLVQDPKVWRKLVRALWKLLKQEFNAEWGLEATHPIGTPEEAENPGIFHPHANFLWIPAAGHSGWVEVDKLRELFGKTVSNILSVKLEDPLVCVVYTQYGYKDPQIWHWSKYVTRCFEGFGSWCGPVRWYGKRPKIRNAAEDHRCHKCGEVPVFGGSATVEDWIEYRDRLQHEKILASHQGAGTGHGHVQQYREEPH